MILDIELADKLIYEFVVYEFVQFSKKKSQSHDRKNNIAVPPKSKKKKKQILKINYIKLQLFKVIDRLYFLFI